MKYIFLTLLSFVFIFPATVKAAEFNDAQKAEINKMIEEYLLSNGENVLKSVNQYQADIEKKDREEANVKAAEFLKKIADNKKMPMAGNPDGDITLVEFFDYNCGYCRRALEELTKVLKDDKELKVVFMDMPILGPASVEAAKWSLAAHKQGKYFEYHTALLEHTGEKNEDTLVKLAKDVGLDVKKLKKDVTSDDIEKTINRNLGDSRDLNIRGTPGFIIAGQIYPGFMQAAQMKETIAKARSEAK